MIDVFEWLIDISVASANASATGSIFLLLVGVAGATRFHLVKYRAGTAPAKGRHPEESLQQIQPAAGA
jgi:hypothetical protein